MKCREPDIIKGDTDVVVLCQREAGHEPPHANMDNNHSWEREVGWTFPDDLITAAWGLIANVPWRDQTPVWKVGAIRWRTAYDDWVTAVRAPFVPAPRVDGEIPVENAGDHAV